MWIVGAEPGARRGNELGPAAGKPRPSETVRPPLRGGEKPPLSLGQVEPLPRPAARRPGGSGGAGPPYPQRSGGGAPAGRWGAPRGGGCRPLTAAATPALPAGRGRGWGRGHVTGAGGRGARPRPAPASLWPGRAPSGGRCRNQRAGGGRARDAARPRLPSLLPAAPRCPSPPSPHGGGARGHRPLPPPAPASPSLLSSALSARGGGRGAPPGGDVRGGDRRNLTLKYLRSECLWILEQNCEFIWKKCCGCSKTLAN